MCGFSLFVKLCRRKLGGSFESQGGLPRIARLWRTLNRNQRRKILASAGRPRALRTPGAAAPLEPSEQSVIEAEKAFRRNVHLKRSLRHRRTDFSLVMRLLFLPENFGSTTFFDVTTAARIARATLAALTPAQLERLRGAERDVVAKTRAAAAPRRKKRVLPSAATAAAAADASAAAPRAPLTRADVLKYSLPRRVVPFAAAGSFAEMLLVAAPSDQDRFIITALDASGNRATVERVTELLETFARLPPSAVAKRFGPISSAEGPAFERFCAESCGGCSPTAVPIIRFFRAFRGIGGDFTHSGGRGPRGPQHQRRVQLYRALLADDFSRCGFYGRAQRALVRAMRGNASDIGAVLINSAAEQVEAAVAAAAAAVAAGDVDVPTPPSTCVEVVPPAAYTVLRGHVDVEAEVKDILANRFGVSVYDATVEHLKLLPRVSSKRLPWWDL